MAEEKKKGVMDYLNALVDQDGLRTEVTITLTDQTLWKIVAGLVAAGIGIAVVAHLLKNVFPNRQMAENNALLQDIKKALNT